MRIFPLSLWLVGLLLGSIATNALSLYSTMFDDDDGDLCPAEICDEQLMNPAAIRHYSSEAKRPTRTTRRLTNAMRLALGLPLNPPKSRRADARPQVSPVPQTTYEGLIEVRNLTDSSSLGYISFRQRASGVFRIRPEVEHALIVTFSLDVGATFGSGIGFEMNNADGPLLGLVQGRENNGSDLSSGSANYLYFNGIGLPGSPPGSVPTELPNTFTLRTGEPRTAESSVWTVDLVTGQLSVVWTNSDGKPATPIHTWVQFNFLYAGGNPDLYQDLFPIYPLSLISLHFVPQTPS
ncbi:hypothetical protein JR316_0002610 [Psilocybe cubensis]|uniref:Uncharacterized protein n=2 Tax=Psilocybe cubensis TaxID=181762 RepID=A0ACB8HD20_PSICU|nr:hypothetical protein JR316_0002610 [Psilocybe cubensis]KAH9485698.1 hypothetical protein JR316_0002610 [Psilocybe cubensis]